MMLRRFARKYSTRDIVEEYRSIPMCPLVDAWLWPMTLGRTISEVFPAPIGRRFLASPPTMSFLAFFGGFHPFFYASDA
jgi:hypothetical protein